MQSNFWRAVPWKPVLRQGGINSWTPKNDVTTAYLQQTKITLLHLLFGNPAQRAENANREKSEPR